MHAVEKSKSFPVDVALAASQGTARPSIRRINPRSLVGGGWRADRHQSRDAEQLGLASERKLAVVTIVERSAVRGVIFRTSRLKAMSWPTSAWRRSISRSRPATALPPPDPIATAGPECPRRLIQQLLLTRIDLVRGGLHSAAPRPT